MRHYETLLRKYDLKTKSKLNENIGKRFGKLIVIERAENSKDSRKVYKCKFYCDNITEVKSKYLYNVDTKSCGCYKKILVITKKKTNKKL